MPDVIFFEHILVFALAILSAVLFFFYLSEAQKRQKFFEEKGYNLLYKATKKAQTLLGQAELEGVKMVADSRVHTHQFEGEYEDQLRLSRESLEKTFTNQLNQLEVDFKNHLLSLQTRNEQLQILSEQLTKQKADDVLKRFEEHLTTMLAATEQRSTAIIEQEIKSTRELINRYKAEQLSLIDENIVAMLEKTLSLVLAKKITLADQSDLVFEALEKAKTENFIV